MKWLDEPRNQLPLLFSTIMQNKNFKSCCAINVLLAQNSKFQKTQTTPNLLMHLIAIAQIIVDFWFWKQMRQCAHNWFHLTIPLFMDVFFEAVFFVRLPYFDWKQCNFHHKNAMNSLEEIWLQFLKKTRKKFSKQQKCYTTSIFILSHTKIFKGLFSFKFYQPLIYLLKLIRKWPTKGEY